MEKKKKKKNQAFEITRFSFWDQSFCYRWVYGFRRDGCAQKPERWTELCNLFLFPKKPYCYCNIMKNINVVLWRLILHDIVDFLFSFFRFSFLTEMLYHMFLKISRKREKCLFVHITFKDILFFHCRIVKYNMSVCTCAYMYLCTYILHTHTCIYI